MERSARILVVDPDPDHLELLQRTLAGSWSVETSSSGDEALALARASDPHVVIADQRLSSLSGLELLNTLGERDPHLGRILLTNYGDTQASIDASEGGRVDAFVAKPCMPHQLRMMVRSVLERCQLERENAELVLRLTSKNQELRGALESLRTLQRRVVDTERLSAIGRMITMIVHDFRNPLTVLRSGCDEIVNGDLDAGELTTISQEMYEETERMNRMCTDLLNVSRTSGGTISQSKIALDECVEAAANALSHEATPAGVQIQANLDSHIEMLLDEDRLRRVLTNLGHNAIEAMPSGGILRFHTRLADDGDAAAAARLRLSRNRRRLDDDAPAKRYGGAAPRRLRPASRSAGAIPARHGVARRPRARARAQARFVDDPRRARRRGAPAAELSGRTHVPSAGKGALKATEPEGAAPNAKVLPH